MILKGGLLGWRAHEKRWGSLILVCEKRAGLSLPGKDKPALYDFV